jgi:hypothetical protein
MEASITHSINWVCFFQKVASDVDAAAALNMAITFFLLSDSDDLDFDLEDVKVEELFLSIFLLSNERQAKSSPKLFSFSDADADDMGSRRRLRFDRDKVPPFEFESSPVDILSVSPMNVLYWSGLILQCLSILDVYDVVNAVVIHYSRYC